jgi:Universal stress protein family
MFQRILLAVDGSDHSKKATAAAAELAGTQTETCTSSTSTRWG